MLLVIGNEKNMIKDMSLCGFSNYEILRRPAAGGTPQNDMGEFQDVN